MTEPSQHPSTCGSSSPKEAQAVPSGIDSLSQRGKISCLLSICVSHDYLYPSGKSSRPHMGWRDAEAKGCFHDSHFQKVEMRIIKSPMNLSKFIAIIVTVYPEKPYTFMIQGVQRHFLYFLPKLSPSGILVSCEQFSKYLPQIFSLKHLVLCLCICWPDGIILHRLEAPWRAGRGRVGHLLKHPNAQHSLQYHGLPDGLSTTYIHTSPIQLHYISMCAEQSRVLLEVPIGLLSRTCSQSRLIEVPPPPLAVRVCSEHLRSLFRKRANSRFGQVHLQRLPEGM